MTAKAVANAAGATPADIPWLKLEVTAHRGNGLLTDATTVLRVNTRGGALTAACDETGRYQSVPYAADYVFLRKGAPLASPRCGLRQRKKLVPDVSTQQIGHRRPPINARGELCRSPASIRRSSVLRRKLHDSISRFRLVRGQAGQRGIAQCATFTTLAV